MKKKIFYGIDFNVYTDTEIDGDFIKENEAVYFENEVHIKGNLKCKYLKTEKGITIDGREEVERWEEVGWYQKVGGSQEVGWYQKVGGYQEVGWYQKVGEYQKVGGYQEVGGSQEVGGDCKIEFGVSVGLYITVKGNYKVGKRIFAGICNWRDITDKDKQIKVGKFEGGEIIHGDLIETGIEEEKTLSGRKIKVELDGKSYTATID